MRGLFITFEGTEGSGKSTQIIRIAERLRTAGRTVRTLREPGGTALSEEIRATLQHSKAGAAMTPETELLLVCASRAQLVREVIRPALDNGEIVLCDRFFDSTVAYQGYGRGLDLNRVRTIIDYAVGETRPDLTLLLDVPWHISEARRKDRPANDRFEAAGTKFFQRVEQGFHAIAAAEPQRVKSIDGTQTVDAVTDAIWSQIQPLLHRN